ncbi:hypothetical protein V1525DRAFT_435232 [Lipomyces kononenkoae]|uniref:Uncharacterized protein n=1 Tax=Lipomyces kononenkoae TaxID=34357 RepID=A0ACC3STA8_LIPKO
MDSVRSIYIPLKAELADTYNRHYWLHKTEFRPSSVRFLEVDQDAFMTECDEGISDEAVTEFMKSHVAGMTMIYESVDLGDVRFDAYQDRECSERKQIERVLAGAITSDGSVLPATPSAVHAIMLPFVRLTLLLDLASSDRGNDGPHFGIVYVRVEG